MRRVFTADAIALGLLAAFVVGVSKTGLPGGALIAIPMLATVFDGRMIAGGTLPILLVADMFAVTWYRRHARWDVLRAVAVPIALGYAAGIAFFIAVGSADRAVSVTIGVIVLLIVGFQVDRMLRSASNAPGGAAVPWTYGSLAGFTTFVANAAGPVVNTFLIRRGLDKGEIVGTSAWLYFLVNVTKITLYVAIGTWTTGGPFFTTDSLLYDTLVVPGVFLGVFAGRILFKHIAQGAFIIAVLVLSAGGAVRLLF